VWQRRQAQAHTAPAGRAFISAGAYPPRGPGEPLGQEPPAPTILGLDTEFTLTRALTRLLARDGYQVAVAANGQEALTACAQQVYTWILCDLHMPELDGRGFYQALQRCQPALCARVVFLTGDTLTPEVQTFLAQTGMPVLTKPFTAACLRGCLTAC
jgi:CheY-like chemotaxis protein